MTDDNLPLKSQLPNADPDLSQGALVLHFAEERRFADDDEPSRFLFPAAGSLLFTDEDDKETEVGTFSAIVVDVRGAITEDVSVFNVFDSNGTGIGYYEMLYEADGQDFKHRVTRISHGDDYFWNPNLLILDRLVVYPEFRGQGFGLLALRALIHRLRASVGLRACSRSFQE